MKRLILLAIALMTLTACEKDEQTAYPIVDKYEHNGKHYIAIERDGSGLGTVGCKSLPLDQ